MKINFTLDRFNSVCDELVSASEQEVAKNPGLALKDAESITAQFQDEVLNKNWNITVQHIVLGFALLPVDSVALLLFVGYKMGQDDAKAAGEIVELEKLFAGPSGQQGEVDG